MPSQRRVRRVLEQHVVSNLTFIFFFLFCVVYETDEALIPKNSSVIVARIPLAEKPRRPYFNDRPDLNSMNVSLLRLSHVIVYLRSTFLYNVYRMETEEELPSKRSPQTFQSILRKKIRSQPRFISRRIPMILQTTKGDPEDTGTKDLFLLRIDALDADNKDIILNSAHRM